MEACLLGTGATVEGKRFTQTRGSIAPSKVQSDVIVLVNKDNNVACNKRVGDRDWGGLGQAVAAKASCEEDTVASSVRFDNGASKQHHLCLVDDRPLGVGGHIHEQRELHVRREGGGKESDSLGDTGRGVGVGT